MNMSIFSPPSCRGLPTYSFFVHSKIGSADPPLSHSCLGYYRPSWPPLSAIFLEPRPSTTQPSISLRSSPRSISYCITSFTLALSKFSFIKPLFIALPRNLLYGVFFSFFPSAPRYLHSLPLPLVFFFSLLFLIRLGALAQYQFLRV